MVGSTFAYFTAQVTGEGGTEDVVNASTISKVEATYTEGSNIGVDGAAIFPDWNGSKTITITNGNDAAIDFTIAFSEYTNTGFANLQYKLEKGAGGATSIVGLTTSDDDNFVKMEEANLKTTGNTETEKNTLVTGHLEKGATQTFTLTFRLKNIDGDQNDTDGNGSFTGKLLASAQASKVTE